MHWIYEVACVCEENVFKKQLQDSLKKAQFLNSLPQKHFHYVTGSWLFEQ